MSSFRRDAPFGKISSVTVTFGRARFTWLMETFWRHYSAEHNFDCALVKSPLSSWRQACRERLFLASLAINVAFIAIFGATSIRAPIPTDLPILRRLECVVGRMPRADATLMRSQIEVNRVEIENAEVAYRSAEGEVRTALRDEPFKSAALRAADSKMRDRSEVIGRTVQDMLVFAARQMSPSGRRALLEVGRCH